MFLTALWDKEEVELCIVSPEFVHDAHDGGLKMTTSLAS